MRYREIISESTYESFTKLWLNVNTQEEIIVPDGKDHITLIQNNPMQFGIEPEQAEEFLRGIRYYSPYAVELASNNGWVRVVYYPRQETAIETTNLLNAWRALEILLDKGLAIEEVVIDIINNGRRLESYTLRGNKLEYFIKKKRIPPSSVYEDASDKVNWAIGKDIEQAKPLSQKDQSKEEYKLIWVDVRKLFQYTNPDQRLDLDDPSGGGNVIGNRIERAIDHFQSGKYMDPSIVNLGWNGINFTDGRHRLVAAYRLGENSAPVLVPADQVEEIVELLK